MPLWFIKNDRQMLRYLSSKLERANGFIVNEISLFSLRDRRCGLFSKTTHPLSQHNWNKSDIEQ